MLKFPVIVLFYFYFLKDTIFGSVSGTSNTKIGFGDAMRDNGKRKKRTIFSEPTKANRQRKQQSRSPNSQNAPRNFFSRLASVEAGGTRFKFINRPRRQADEWENVEETSTIVPNKTNMDRIKTTFVNIFDACVDFMGKVANAFRSNRNGTAPPQGGSDMNPVNE